MLFFSNFDPIENSSMENLEAGSVATSASETVTP